MSSFGAFGNIPWLTDDTQSCKHHDVLLAYEGNIANDEVSCCHKETTLNN